MGLLISMGMIVSNALSQFITWICPNTSYSGATRACPPRDQPCTAVVQLLATGYCQVHRTFEVGAGGLSVVQLNDPACSLNQEAYDI